MRTKIQAILGKDGEKFLNQTVTIKGWLRTVRDQKAFAFLEVNDGSCFSSLQVVAESGLPGYAAFLAAASTGASVAIMGSVVPSPGKNQRYELHAQSLELVGRSDPESYPLQKKRHSFEFLRTIAHLRARTNTFGAVSRVRNALAFATHLFFQSKGFLWVNTPIITASDCEGAGAMFRVTTLPDRKPPTLPDGSLDYGKDFFGKMSYLTVSGQLNGEAYACALSDIYTFGPTFRAENSHTSRHVAEFWMIEPEMAFADLKDDMDLAESYVKYVLEHVLHHCVEDLQFFDQFIEKGLIARLQHVHTTPFERLTYTEAVRLLEKSGHSFEYGVEWGLDLQSEHERYLTEQVFQKPVILTDYPAQIKAFYMRANDDGKTVAAMDVLVPKIGEIIGGSQREERLDVLGEKIEKQGLPKEAYWWYLQLREYGTVPHAGFGAGFERLVQFVTGMENIRDVSPFPRVPGNADF